MFRGTVAVLTSCALLAITLRQYLDVPGQIAHGRSIIESAIPSLRNDSLHSIPLDSASLVLMTSASSSLIAAVIMIEALCF